MFREPLARGYHELVFLFGGLILGLPGKIRLARGNQEEISKVTDNTIADILHHPHANQPAKVARGNAILLIASCFMRPSKALPISLARRRAVLLLG